MKSYPSCRVFFRKKFSEGAKPNFQEMTGVKIKYINLCSTYTSFIMLEQTGLALALVSFNFFSIICYKEDLENIVTVWVRKPRRITV